MKWLLDLLLIPLVGLVACAPMPLPVLAVPLMFWRVIWCMWRHNDVGCERCKWWPGGVG